MTNSQFYLSGGIMATVAEKKLAKRINILEAAYSLFSDKGFNTTAIDEVVKIAGVAKGTFYLYFKDKYDLLDQIIIHKSIVLIDDCVSRIDSAGASSLSGRMCLFFDMMVREIESDKSLAALMCKNISASIAVFFQSDNERIVSERQRIISDPVFSGEDEKTVISRISIVFDMAFSALFDCLQGFLPVEKSSVISAAHMLIESSFKGGEKLD